VKVQQPHTSHILLLWCPSQKTKAKVGPARIIQTGLDIKDMYMRKIVVKL